MRRLTTEAMQSIVILLICFACGFLAGNFHGIASAFESRDAEVEKLKDRQATLVRRIIDLNDLVDHYAAEQCAEVLGDLR